MSNPYPMGSPRWNLYEGIRSATLLVETHTKDIQRYQQKLAEATTRVEEFSEALTKLDPEFDDAKTL